jgi:dihydroorotate dehydrogenase (fumarate)
MDLTTTYLGLQLKNPLVPSASPLSGDIGTMRKMEDAGAAAIVLQSLFEEQIRHESRELDHYLQFGTESFAEAVTYFPQSDDYTLGPEEYLNHIRQAKEAIDIPIIASLNGVTVGGWIDYSRKMEQAGADALELNVYYIPTNMRMSGVEVESLYLDILKAVKAAVKIPVAMKLSPFFSSLGHFTYRLDEQGVDGLVLFNRFYQPDIDLERLEVVPNIILSTPQAMRLPLRWIAILYGKIKADLAATSGIHTHLDVLKMLMAGAKVTMLCSALLRNGVGHLGTVLNDLKIWMEEYEYESVSMMQGSMSQKNIADPSAFERANYMKALQGFRPNI